MASTALVSCGDLLDVDSKRLTTDEEYGLNTPSDSIYSMFGLFTQLQNLLQIEIYFHNNFSSTLYFPAYGFGLVGFSEIEN